MNGAATSMEAGAALVVPPEPLIVIEHPCIVKNAGKAIKSLGGVLLLDQLLNDPGLDKSIEASLRPDDPFAKTIPAGPVSTGNVLLKITVPKMTGRKRKRGSDEAFQFYSNHYAKEPSSNSESSALVRESRHERLLRALLDNPTTYTVTPIGSIKETHRFRYVPDFQYASSTSPLMNKLKRTIMPYDYLKVKEFQIDPFRGIAPGLDVGPPPVGNLIKTAFNWSYRQNAYTRITVDETGEKRLTTMNPPLRYVNHVVELDAETIPSQVPVFLEPEHSLDAKLRACIRKFREELEKRPIMAKRVQGNLVANSDHLLRRAWCYVGYMFSAGPFRDAIIKFGVDPRKDPVCAKYQTLWFQLPGETGYGRSKGSENVPSRLNGKTPRAPKIRAKSRDSHIFDGETLFRDGKTWQICDITDPLLKDFIDNTPLRDDCDVSFSGWYGNGTWCAIKAVMKEKIAMIAEGRPRDDYIFKEILPAIPAFLTLGNANTAHAGSSADREVLRITANIRANALQMLRNQKRKKQSRDWRERGGIAAGSPASPEIRGMATETPEDFDMLEEGEDMEEEEGDMDVDEEDIRDEDGNDIEEE